MTSAVLLDSLNWRMVGLCGQVDPELFFVDADGHPDIAQRICDVCPVRLDCIEDSLGQPEITRRGSVAGGWYFPCSTKRPVRPHRDDLDLYEQLKSEGRI